MNLLDFFRPRRRAAGPAAADDFWYGPAWAAAVGAAGQKVTPERALQLTAVTDCLKALTEPIAWLPKKIYRRLPDGRRQAAPDHPVAALLTRRPNGRQTPSQFFAEMQWNLAFHRNAYALVIPGADYAIGALEPVHPARVRPVVSGAETWYELRGDDGRTRRLGEGEIWHLLAPPFTADGRAGQPVTETAREALSAALAVQDYAARFFRNDGQAGGILEHAGSFKTEEDRRKLMEAWRLARTGANAHRDALLEFGIKYNRAELDNEKSQFIETRKELDLAIARIWRVPPHKIGILDRATFSNIEQQALEFVSDTLMPWVVLWEQAVWRDLLLEDERYYCRINVDALLRGDLKTRYEAYGQGINWGFLSPNEVREREDMDERDGGGEFLRPVNMAPSNAPPAPPRAEVPHLEVIHGRA